MDKSDTHVAARPGWGGGGPASLKALRTRAAAPEAPSCSFCTGGAPEVRLIAGGTISDDCAERINDAFKRRPGGCDEETVAGALPAPPLPTCPPLSGR